MGNLSSQMFDDAQEHIDFQEFMQCFPENTINYVAGNHKLFEKTKKNDFQNVKSTTTYHVNLVHNAYASGHRVGAELEIKQ